MHTPALRQLLQIWERGALGSGTHRGLLLLSAVRSESPSDLLHFSIGKRDACLLDLYEQLFGSRIDALATCDACREQFQLGVDLASIRVGCDEVGATHHLSTGDYVITFRSANSTDLLAVERESTHAGAERVLLARCVLEARQGALAIMPAALPDDVVGVLAERMSEADEQAEVVFDVQCAACGKPRKVWFDIAVHLWAALDRWARGLLQEVHQLAAAYGWSERQVLALSSMRRRAYLALIGAPSSQWESAWQA